MTDYKALYGRVWRKEHAEQVRAKRKEKYQQLKEAGICVVCCKKPAREGRTKCEECAQRGYRLLAEHRKREQEEGAK